MPDGCEELLDFYGFRNTRLTGNREKSSMSLLSMVIVTLMLIAMGTMMLVKALRAFGSLEFMPFTGTKGENRQNSEQSKTFHHVPLS
jgi:hypothetical protein